MMQLPQTRSVKGIEKLGGEVKPGGPKTHNFLYAEIV